MHFLLLLSDESCLKKSILKNESFVNLITHTFLTTTVISKNKKENIGGYYQKMGGYESTAYRRELTAYRRGVDRIKEVVDHIKEGVDRI
jgi:hypothetical protein